LLKSNITDNNCSTSINLVSNKCKTSIVDDTIDANKTTTYKCDYCKNTFNYKNNYYRHRKTCSENNKSNELVEELKTKLNNAEVELIKKELEFAKKETELYKKIEEEKSELLNTFMANANNLLNKANDNTKITAQAMQSVSMSALKFANDKYSDAPVLKAIENFNMPIITRFMICIKITHFTIIYSYSFSIHKCRLRCRFSVD
jgi:Zn-dependent oligopeptidase